MSFKPPPLSSFGAHPAVRRARGYRLYGPDGRRFLDLYQDAGRGMLGSRPTGLVLRFKAVLEKTGTAVLPSVWEGRLTRLLTSFFPGYPYLAICSSGAEALELLKQEQGSGFDASAIPDPWDHGYGGKLERASAVSIWRPFLPVPEADFILPVLPGAGSWGATPVLGRKPLKTGPAPAAAFLLAPQTYGAELFFRWVSQAAGDPWSGFPEGPWRRIGPYLFPRCGEREYPLLAEELISCGLYPSPEYRTPSIVPWEYDPGEVRALRAREGTWTTDR
jgi:hypothetical protein